MSEAIPNPKPYVLFGLTSDYWARVLEGCLGSIVDPTGDTKRMTRETATEHLCVGRNLCVRMHRWGFRSPDLSSVDLARESRRIGRIAADFFRWLDGLPPNDVTGAPPAEDMQWFDVYQLGLAWALTTNDSDAADVLLRVPSTARPTYGMESVSQEVRLLHVILCRTMRFGEHVLEMEQTKAEQVYNGRHRGAKLAYHALEAIVAKDWKAAQKALNARLAHFKSKEFDPRHTFKGECLDAHILACYAQRLGCSVDLVREEYRLFLPVVELA